MNGSAADTPAGWTKFRSALATPSNPDLTAFCARVVDGTEGASFDFATGSSVAGSVGVASYVGVDTTAPIAAGPSDFGGNGPNMACASITVPAGAWLIGGAALNSSNTSNWITEPTGWNSLLWDLSGRTVGVL